MNASRRMDAIERGSADRLLSCSVVLLDLGVWLVMVPNSVLGSFA